VLFPGVVSPILIGRESSMTLVKRAERKKSLIGIVCQRDPEVEHPDYDDLYQYGVFAKVMKQLNM
jgi:ATP-dependent Lon protease